MNTGIDKPGQAIAVDTGFSERTDEAATTEVLTHEATTDEGLTLAAATDAHAASTPPGYGAAGSTDALSRRLKRIEGQVRGVEKMVAEERYCIDVLTQIAAIQAGLKAVALGLLDDHMAHCVVDAAREGGEAQATKLAEVSDAMRRLVR